MLRSTDDHSQPDRASQDSPRQDNQAPLTTTADRPTSLITDMADPRKTQRETLRRLFPEFNLLVVGQVVLPVWHLKVEAEVLARSELTTMALYVLRAIDLELPTAQTIADLFGIEEHDLAVAAAELLKHNLIQQGRPQGSRWGEERLLTLTERGRSTLRSQGKLPVPKRRTYHLQMNAITRALESPDSKVWSGERLIKEGLFVLPEIQRTQPTLGELTHEDVAAALKGERSFLGVDLVDLLALRATYRQYIPGGTIYLLRRHATREERIVLFHQSRFLTAESAVLQRLHEGGVHVLPADAAQVDPPLPPIPPSLPAAQAEKIHDALEQTRALEARVQLLTQVLRDEREERASADHTTAGAAERIHQLEGELSHAQGELARYEGQGARELAHLQVQFLRTEHHRPVLEQTLRDAQEEVIIISPWLNRRTVNPALVELLRGALARGVIVRIGYGMGNEPDRQEADRHAANLRGVLLDLRTRIPSSLEDKLELWRTQGTHQKILVCDRSLAVTTSFNWLSYLGSIDEGYRNETGALFRDPQPVADLATEAKRVLDGAVRTSLPPFRQ